MQLVPPHWGNTVDGISCVNWPTPTETLKIDFSLFPSRTRMSVLMFSLFQLQMWVSFAWLNNITWLTLSYLVVTNIKLSNIMATGLQTSRNEFTLHLPVLHLWRAPSHYSAVTFAFDSFLLVIFYIATTVHPFVIHSFHFTLAWLWSQWLSSGAC